MRVEPVTQIACVPVKVCITTANRSLGLAGMMMHAQLRASSLFHAGPTLTPDFPHSACETFLITVIIRGRARSVNGKAVVDRSRRIINDRTTPPQLLDRRHSWRRTRKAAHRKA